MVFCSLKHTYAGKKSIRGKTIWIWTRNTALFLTNLRISDLRIVKPRKFGDLRFVD
jgi:hypothetical protein